MNIKGRSTNAARVSSQLMLERIINGKLERFYKEKVLLDQEFVKDNHIIIKNIIKEHNIKINAFKHISIP